MGNGKRSKTHSSTLLQRGEKRVPRGVCCLDLGGEVNKEVKLVIKSDPTVFTVGNTAVPKVKIKP